MSSRRALAPLAVAAVAAAALVPAVSGAAVAAPPAPEVTLTPLGTYRTGAFDEGASEIVAHDPERQRLFVVNAHAGTVDVLDIRDARNPVKLASLDTPGANSVAVQGNLVAVAEQADEKTGPGTVSFFDATTFAKVSQVPAGALPDMVRFTGSGDFALVANEGEPEGYCEGQVDPEGSVSVIDLRAGAAKATVRTADFTAYNAQVDALRAEGVRIYGPNASVAQDLEPEYITTSTNGKTAWVTLQEANAVATIDVRTARVTDIAPLGLKDHSVAGQGLDASDKDKAINIAQWPVKGMYQPDSIASYAVKGQTYLVTANEGDARDWDCYAEEERVKSLTLDPAAFPNAVALQKDSALGRLTVSTATSKTSAAGITELHVLGGRSISVRSADGTLVWDSGDAFEQLTAAADPELFNADNAENDSADTRSDNKGPEPEGLDLGKLGGRAYAFVGLERTSGIAVVDVTNPAAGRIAGYAHNRIADGDPEAGTAGDLGPEGVHFIAGEDSPTGTPLLAVGNEISGTTTLWEISTH
ncbi:choice-of-anchor I family protein [Knoellia subterranea]|uniref:Alkaline phosphatase n=1 Tax=Knoellia subterranea KCTC 19937 TaxID=1385521 RepID=A0A0A0JQG0_9MICO|nr:choice-of-anchor I family protein [Knoellia subterranea]KGN38272.1 alkaline phosphatase [Knoellia subterranea KCTC 19937]